MLLLLDINDNSLCYCVHVRTEDPIVFPVAGNQPIISTMVLKRYYDGIFLRHPLRTWRLVYIVLPQPTRGRSYLKLLTLGTLCVLYTGVSIYINKH